MQVKKIISVLLTVCLLFSLTAPAYAVDEVYSITDDTTAISPAIYYTEGYYPGLIAELRSSMTFANNRIAHGSFGTMNYNPSIFYRSASGSTFTIPFNSLTPYVTADQSDISGVYSISRTTLLQGDRLIAYLPSTSDAYFDFQSSNIAFDQQDANANTFYINGTLTFNLRNLWNFSGAYETTSFYLASDPLAVQLLIDGKAYGDIIDVTGYTSPFTALYNGGIPAYASVTFNNFKVYYQGDTPDMVGFRVYTGSAFTDGQYNYNSAGDFVAVDVTNTVTMRFTDLPDITFVNEGGDGYAGDLSGIQSLLSVISEKISSILNFNTSLYSILNSILGSLRETGSDLFFVNAGGGLSAWNESPTVSFVLREGLQGLRSILINNFSAFYDSGEYFNHGGSYSTGYSVSFTFLLRQGFLGLRALLTDSDGYSFIRKLYYNQLSSQSYVADTVFPWQSYNMQTHELNAATNITGQNNLFFTAFQSIEDKLGRLAYVFGSDEDLALKDSADPGTDAFRENFGGGLSLGQIKDGADVVAGVNGLFDSGYSFGDAFTEIAGEDGFLLWFSADTAAALDATGSLMTLDDSDPYNMQIYYDQVQKVKEKREAGDD